MNLWIDDIRPAPEGWEWAKNYDSAVAAFERGSIVAASFDHDLGFILDDAETGDWDYLWVPKNEYVEDALTGYDLIMWVVKNNCWPTESTAVHSMNPIGHARICGIIERYGPYSVREAIVYNNGNHDLHGVRYSKED